MKYLVCRNGNRISVKRSDRYLDFGDIIGEATTIPQAHNLARRFRQERDHTEWQPALIERCIATHSKEDTHAEA